MARKRKINKRAVAALVVVGAILLIGLAVVTVDRWLPRDPVAAAEQGDQAFQKEDYARAEELYRVAVNATDRSNSTYLLKLAKTEFQLFQIKGVDETKRRQRFRQVLELLRQAVRVDANCLDAQQMLCDIYWDMARASEAAGSSDGWTDFIGETDRMLQMDPHRAVMYLLRADAKGRVMELRKTRDPAQVQSILADYRKAVDLQPDDVACCLKLIAFLHQMGMTDEVEKTFEKVIELNPDKAELRAAYSDYLRQAGRKAEALAQIQEAIRRQPNSTVGYKAKALFLRENKQFPEALEALEEALKVDDSDYQVYREQAAILIALDRNDEAADVIRRGISTLANRRKSRTQPQELFRLDDAAYQLHYILAAVLLDSLDRGTAGNDPNAPLQEVRQSLEQLTRLAPNRPERAKIAGLLAFREGRLQEAAVLLGMGLDPEAGTFDMRTADKLVTALVRLGQPNRAQELLERMAQHTSPATRVSLLLARAELMVMSRDYAGAMDQVTQALALDLDNPAARDLKAILDVLVGDKESLPEDLKLSGRHLALLAERAAQWISERDARGLVLLEDLHRKAPANQQIIQRLLDLYVRLGKPELAEKLYDQARDSDAQLAEWVRQEIDIRKEKDPAKRLELLKARVEATFTDPLQKSLALASLYQNANQPQEAARQLEEAARIDANHPDVIQRMFIWQMQQQNWDQAGQWVQRATQTNADGVGGRMYAARLAVAQRQFERAAGVLAEVVASHPRSKLARIMLADCYRLTGSYDKAQALFEGVLGEDSANVQALVGMAMLTAAQNKFEEHRNLVERAYRLPAGKQNEYIQQEMLKITEARARPEDLPQIIEQRTNQLKKDPNDLDNARALALLWELAGQADRAEAFFRYVYQKSPDPLAGARPLAEFYARTKRQGDLVSFLGDLEQVPQVAKDPVGLQILVGDTLGLRDPSIAERAYRKAAQVDPNDPRGHLALGRFMEGFGRWRDAIRSYSRYRELVPDNPMVPLLIIGCQINDEQFEEAQAGLQNVFSKDPMNPLALELRGNLAFRQRRFEDALKDFDLALRSSPGNVGVLRDRARLYLSTGQPDLARTDLEAARRISQQPGVLLEYAAVCRQLGDSSAAELAYLDLLSRQKGYGPALQALMELYLDTGNWPSLEAQLTDAKKLLPQEPVIRLIEYRMWTLRKDDARAIAGLEDALAVLPESPSIVQTYLSALVDAGQYQKALAQCDRLPEKAPLRAIVLGRKGRALAGLRRFPEADSAFVGFLKENLPVGGLSATADLLGESYGATEACKRVEAWAASQALPKAQTEILLGWLYAKAKDYPRGIEAIRRARASAINALDQYELGVTLALMYSESGNANEAIKTYQDLLAVSPNDLRVLNNLAYVYADDANEPAQALPHARRALELAPGNANVVDTYGWVLVQQGQYAKGVEVLRRVVAMEPFNAVFHYHLGCAYERNRQLRDAAKEFELGLKQVDASKGDPVEKLLQEGLARVGRNPSGE